MTAPTEGTVKLSPSGERLMRALAGAAIDPGELTWSEGARAIPTDPGQGMSRVAYRPERDGLVELLGWTGSTFTALSLTPHGVAVCMDHGFIWAARS